MHRERIMRVGTIMQIHPRFDYGIVVEDKSPKTCPFSFHIFDSFKGQGPSDMKEFGEMGLRVGTRVRFEVDSMGVVTKLKPYSS